MFDKWVKWFPHRGVDKGELRGVKPRVLLIVTIFVCTTSVGWEGQACSEKLYTVNDLIYVTSQINASCLIIY